MKLLTAGLLKRLPPLFSTEERRLEDIVVPCRFFAPDSCYAWFPFEFDPKTRFFFGWVEGQYDSELAHFDLDYLESFRGLAGMKVERDLYWIYSSLAEVKNRWTDSRTNMDKYLCR